MNMAASSIAAAAADVLPQQKYDVFLSFRGEDTRLKFTSHLYAALKGKKVYTYMDDKTLERGDEIGPALLSAIEKSKLSIIIFSKHYASSPWCLDELVHILKCKQVCGQLVVPVFFDIDPSHVRWQEGTYADAFADLEHRFKDNMDKVCKWREAITTAANLSGFHSQSQNIRNEYELVKTIVGDVLKKLNRNLSYAAKGQLVGMERHIEQVELLLSIHAQEVLCFRSVGIWGMGGCGKTTLADAVFHRNSSKFHACVFLANVREQSEKHGLYRLRNELLCKVLKEENFSIDSPSIGSSFVLERLSRTNVLVVLDDVSDSSQLEFLHEVRFGYGSRVIITTRNRSLLKKAVHEDHIYKVNELHVDEALQLFQSIAFEDDSSMKEYSNLSAEVVDYAGRNPLAVKVLASSFLHCNDKEAWEEELKKLKKFPNRKIQDVLRWSYDGLEENEKGIFLDIACFLKGENVCVAKTVLEMHGFFPLSGIGVLTDMSLISISNNHVEMHDLLQEMGRAIEGGVKELGKRKRVWDAMESYQVLRNETGTSNVEALEAIYLDMSKIPELQLSPTAFRNMQNLKLLKFFVPQPAVHEECKRQRRMTVKEIQPSSFPFWLPMMKAFQCFLAKSRMLGSLRLLDSYDKVWDYDEAFEKCCRVHLPKGLESLPKELRYLYWDGYPLKSMLSKHAPENLVEIHMPRSQVKQLWNGVQNLGCLKRLNLNHSRQLSEVPDLSGSPNIERIDLSECTRLVGVPSYFQNLEKLTYLNLGKCENLKKFCEIPCNIEDLNLSGSGVAEISPSIWSHEKLHTLDLSFCRDLKNLPSSSDSCKVNVSIPDQSRCGLKHLYLSYSGLESIPDCIFYLSHLESLRLTRCSRLKIRWPSTPSVMRGLCSLKRLDVRFCRVLEDIADSLICLSTLQNIDLSGTMIESIPTSIKFASGLRILCLYSCTNLRSLPELPSGLEELDVHDCTSLKSVASSRSTLTQPWELNEYRDESFDFSTCWELDESARNNIMDDARLRCMRIASSSNSNYGANSLKVYCPGNEIPRWLSYQSDEGCEINIKFPHLEDYSSCFTFALAAVFGPPNPADIANNKTCFGYLICACNFKTNDGEDYELKVISTDIWELDNHVEVFCDKNYNHVVLFCDKNYNRQLIPFNRVTEASFRFYVATSYTSDKQARGFEVKKCGVMLYK